MSDYSISDAIEAMMVTTFPIALTLINIIVFIIIKDLPQRSGFVAIHPSILFLLAGFAFMISSWLILTSMIFGTKSKYPRLFVAPFSIAMALDLLGMLMLIELL